MDLNAALKQFDVVEANIAKVEAVWSRLRTRIPRGVAFVGESPEARDFQQLVRDFEYLLNGLPPIDGWRITSTPLGLDEIASMRLDAAELVDLQAEVAVDRAIDEPGRQLDEYRFRFRQKRRALVRARILEITAEVDRLLELLGQSAATLEPRASLDGEHWARVRSLIAELDRLLGSSSRREAWGALNRHLAFAMVVDLIDIRTNDWPSVKKVLASLAYDATEPLPVAAADLGQLVATKPKGTVGTGLNWSTLDDQAFERLVFSIIDSASGYEKAEWLMQTRAPDRGRDLSVQRVREDSLSGPHRERVIIQCKHWLRKSVGDVDVSDVLAKMVHWEPPIVDELIIATSGRFTADAVSYVEKHNHAGKRPRLEMWPESRLESLLAQRPAIVALFGLR